MSPRQASIILADLGIKKSTATRRIVRAAAAGDPGVLRVESGWLASEAWWRAQFRERPKMGRPRKS